MRRHPENIYAVAEALRAAYGDFDHYNRKNPLDELIFILCSVKTTESSYRATYLQFKREFPTFSSVAEAQEEYLARPLASGGLQNMKARAIRKLVSMIVAEFGSPTLAPLKRMGDSECERFLTGLPGVGKKVARCVMMYSLGREVFPVDTHCWRICRRLGWVRATRADGTCSDRDMDRLQNKVPAGLRFTLHVNMVSLGRDSCTSRRPDCGGCPVAASCKKIGAAAR